MSEHRWWWRRGFWWTVNDDVVNARDFCFDYSFSKYVDTFFAPQATTITERLPGNICFRIFEYLWLRVLDKAEYSAFESTLNSLLSYRIVLSGICLPGLVFF